MSTATTFDYQQGGREVLRDFFTPKTGEGIVQGMMVALDHNFQLIKAVGAANEYAMVAENDQSTGLCDNGGRISCMLGECEFLTSYYTNPLGGFSYMDRLEVDAGTPGSLKIYDPMGAAPVVGRFMGYITRTNVTTGVVTTLIRVLLSRQ